MRMIPFIKILLVAGAVLGSIERGSAAAGETALALDPESGQGRAESAGRALLGLDAPALTLTTIDGETVDLGKIYGKQPVYLKFWATWCVPCREQMPAFEQDYEALKDRVTVIAVNTNFNETLDRVRRYRQKHGLHMPIVIDDGRLTAALNLRVTPQHVVIGRDGRVLYVGHLEDAKLHQAFEAALKEEGASTAVRSPGTEPVFGVGDKPFGLNLVETTAGTIPVAGPIAGRYLRAILFFSPWCESYLVESRPQTAEACRRARLAAETLSTRANLRWLGVASGLWASDKDVAEYREKLGVGIPLTLDGSGQLFRAFGVHDVPTIILIDHEGRVVAKIGPGVVDPTARIVAFERKT